jgi:orotidine-5'-phosphate decarboxylase
VLAVTVLTSLADDDLAATGVTGRVTEQVVRLGRLAHDCGLDGVVCSAREIVALRGACGAAFKLVVPGIRPAWSSADDQRRIVTPGEAMALGADFLVIGRPITAAADPAEAARRIADEIGRS